MYFEVSEGCSHKIFPAASLAILFEQWGYFQLQLVKIESSRFTIKMHDDWMLVLQSAYQSTFNSVVAVFIPAITAADGVSESRGVCICMFLFPLKCCLSRKSLKCLVRQEIITVWADLENPAAMWGMVKIWCFKTRNFIHHKLLFLLIFLVFYSSGRFLFSLQ